MNKSTFESKVEKDPISGCWLWKADIRNGYGSLWHRQKTRYAHRVSCEFYKNIVDDTVEILHTCKTKRCVNPDHLFVEQIVEMDKTQFELSIERIPFCDCWFWNRKISDDGYGYWKRGVPAHQLAYMLYRGPIPLEAWVLHTCDMKACVNPQHLYLGDHKANTIDAIKRGRVRKSELGLALQDRILALRASGLSQRQIAYQLGCSQGTVWQVLAGFPIRVKDPKYGSTGLL